VKKISCTITRDGQTWSQTCGARSGGGMCLGEGMCIDYLADKDGGAYATTIAFDGKKRMRMLRTELKNGQAQRFFRESLKRVQ